MDLPAEFTKPELGMLDPNDTIPSNIDPSTISFLSEFFSAPLAFFMYNPRTAAAWGHDTLAVSFQTITAYTDGDDQGWTTVDTVLVRLNTSLTPFGRFPIYSNKPPPHLNWTETLTGYDAAVCVQKYEPWTIEAYNASTGPPSALQIVTKGKSSISLLPSGNIRGARIASNRYLNTTGKDEVFSNAHINSIFRMWEINTDQGKNWGYYGPSPTVGPVVHPCQTFLLTLTYSTDCLFYG